MSATRKILFAIIGSTIGFGAFAQEASSDAWMHVAASKSRLQVTQPGPVASSEAYDFSGIGSDKTRGQVLSELTSAKMSGEFDALNGEAQRFDLTGYRIVASR
jgi:hypothetical protein